MKILKYLLIILLAFITIALTGSFSLISTWKMYIPIIVVGLYLLLSFIHYHLYVLNINNKLQNKKTIILPDIKTFRMILDITYGAFLIVFLAIVFFPIVTYSKDTVSINLPKNIDDVDLRSIIVEIEEQVTTEDSIFYVLDQFEFGINSDKEITSCYFKFVIVNEGESKTYTTECKNNKMIVKHDYYSPNIPYYRLEYTLDDIIADFDIIDFDELVSNYSLQENETIFLHTWFGYIPSDTFTMKPASNIDFMYEYRLDGSVVQITEETEYDKSQYYVISTYSKIDGEYYDLMSLQYTYIIEYE